jgi:hypothetical protein
MINRLLLVISAILFGIKKIMSVIQLMSASQKLVEFDLKERK